MVNREKKEVVVLYLDARRCTPCLAFLAQMVRALAL